MTLPSQRFKLLAGIAVILLLGFVGTSVASYLVARDAVRQRISAHALPLTSDTVYSEVQRDLLRPVFIASMMANDTFVRDWVLSGETDADKIVSYLARIQSEYGARSSFLVSANTGKYYFPDGVLKQVKEGEPRDAWFFRVRDMQQDYETNVDLDMANRDAMTVFINYRLIDQQHQFIGAVGVGLTLELLGQQINDLAHRYQRRIYFVTPQGRIVLHSRNVAFADQAFPDVEGLGEYWPRLQAGRSGEVLTGEYQSVQGTALVNARFIPELGWTLVVEEDEDADLGGPRRMLYVNLGLSMVATLLVLWLVALMIQRHQHRLEQMATSDALTGALNRQGFDLVLMQALKEQRRNHGSLVGMMFDIDLFKQINDSHGHLTGDSVLVMVAELARQCLRSNDILVRWGGEEFFVLLKDCDEVQAGHLAQRLCQAVAEHDFGLHRTVTLSVGVAQFIEGQTEDAFFARADAALYRSKQAGRNRVTRASTFMSAERT
jgi:diguanylate cyclase (GGDEF)-like protein